MPAPKPQLGSHRTQKKNQNHQHKTLTHNPKLNSQQIRDIESQIKLSQHQDLNPITDLIDLLHQFTCSSSSSTELIHTTIYTLHRICSTLLRQGRIHHAPVSTQSDQSVRLVTEWLKQRYHEFISGLLSLLRLQEEIHASLALDSLTILMSLVRSETELSNSLNQNKAAASDDFSKVPVGGFESATFRKLVKALLIKPEPSSVLGPIRSEVKVEFVLRYFNYCDDIRYHFLKDAAYLCQSHKPTPTGELKSSSKSSVDVIESSRSLATNLLHYLEHLTTMPTESHELNQFWTGQPPKTDYRKRRGSQKSKKSKKVKVINDGSTGIFDDSSDEEEGEEEVQDIKPPKSHPLLSLRSHQKAFSECWISFLSLGLIESEIKRILSILHTQVIPNMIDPKILMDFLVDCTDLGGTISILALNGLFTLMTKHNLDYPAFYTRLYALLDRSVLHVRHRPRFFRMLNTFLSSTHLPVNIVASFLKKLARLSLFAPPGAIITIIPFCYNLIKRHPSCMSMLHRQNISTSVNSAQSDDPFDVNEPDPLKSGAIFSSLWELASLKSHYLASIATLSKVFSEAFDKPNYDLEDFLDHTYTTLFKTELNRQIRKPPALSILASAFKPSTTGGSFEPDDIVSQMWKF